MQGHYVGAPPYQIEIECTKDDDALARRLKNRERQRRYRARKRLEAERNKAASALSQPTPLQIEWASNNHDSRVHCARDWKKDARRAHESGRKEAPHDGPLFPPLPSVNESEEADSPPTTNEEQLMVRDGPNSLKLGTEKAVAPRRDWKAEARSKKN